MSKPLQVFPNVIGSAGTGNNRDHGRMSERKLERRRTERYMVPATHGSNLTHFLIDLIGGREVPVGGTRHRAACQYAGREWRADDD